jgi:hypothetical protein
MPLPTIPGIFIFADKHLDGVLVTSNSLTVPKQRGITY